MCRDVSSKTDARPMMHSASRPCDVQELFRILYASDELDGTGVQ